MPSSFLALPDLSRATRLLAAVIALGLFTSCDGNKSSTNAPTIAADRSAAYRELDITLPDLQGESYTLTSNRATDVHVLAFWAAWCTPCQAELAQLKVIFADLKSRGLHVYAISIDSPETASRAASIAKQYNYGFPVLVDRETSVLTRYNQSGEIPFYVVLNADGEKIKEHQGYNRGDEVELRSYLESLLPKP